MTTCDAASDDKKLASWQPSTFSVVSEKVESIIGVSGNTYQKEMDYITVWWLNSTQLTCGHHMFWE